jgi:phosphoglycerol transferase MdoB-like AlkP superfamily enzyme
VYCWDYDDFGYDGGFDWGEWIKEEDFVYSALDYMIPKNANKKEYGGDAQKFFTFYTTVSTHGPYDNNSKCADQVEYNDFVKYGATAQLQANERKHTQWYTNVLNAYKNESETFINRLVNYQAAVVGFDRALGVLINRLKEYNIYDDTTIILYSDHNAYYQRLRSDLRSVFASIGCESLIVQQKGLLGIAVEEVDCDYYDYLNGKTDLGKVYHGEYMIQYSFAEVTNAELFAKYQKLSKRGS